MPNEILEPLYKERTKLIQELQNSKPYQRITLIDQLIAAYGGSVEGTALPSGGKQTTVSMIPKAPTKREQIIRHAIDCINYSGGHAPMRTIKAYLSLHGVATTDSSLSAYLSTEKDIFVADRTKGWGIKGASPASTIEELLGDDYTPETKTPTDAVTSVGANGGAFGHQSVTRESKGESHDLF